ncbi:MAG: hypothetical protein RL273_1210, partial [Bacteroidota bacterium]
MRPFFLISLRTKLIFLFLMLFISSYFKAQTTAIRMDMEWLSSTTNTADFQIRLTNTGTSSVKLNSLVIRGVHAPSLTTGAITWKALNDNTLPGWLNWPNTGTANLPYINSQRKLNYSSATSIFNASTAPLIPSGPGVVAGTFRMSTTTTWTPNSDFNYVWDAATGGLVCYINGSTQVSSIVHYTSTNANTVSQGLIVTASSAQPLNSQTISPPSSSVLSGDATICAGSTTNLSVAVTGGTAPYTVTVTDGTNNYSATGASPVSISVSPSATSTYSIVSVTGGGTGTGNTGSATVTVTPVPTQPTLACYETAVFNATSCSWVVSGTQPTQPTGLACYETSTFNTTSCSWIVSGTQPTQPTGLACYETSTFNTTSCSWVVTGTQPTQPTIACYETATFNTTTCAWVVIGTQPTQPTIACYETAEFNATSCSWVVSGSQPAQPTGLTCNETATFNGTSCSWVVSGTQYPQPTVACYETASFNTTSCTWVVNGSQPLQPTGLACYQTAAFNTISCSWIVSGTQSIDTTIASACGSYTWSNNGQTYTSSGTYSGFEINCIAHLLVLTITPTPTATINYSSSSFCKTITTVQSVTQTGTIGGTYSASPYGLSINSSTGAINPSTST